MYNFGTVRQAPVLLETRQPPFQVPFLSIQKEISIANLFSGANVVVIYNSLALVTIDIKINQAIIILTKNQIKIK